MDTIARDTRKHFTGLTRGPQNGPLAFAQSARHS
jgi:hypothetical protein